MSEWDALTPDDRAYAITVVRTEESMAAFEIQQREDEMRMQAQRKR